MNLKLVWQNAKAVAERDKINQNKNQTDLT